ncbi:hypothetical protein MA16_Dca027153 [Dendrobium catenatum]|uniref:RING-CH-type domain-containing protein n=1 Tax=Dendrobium catenatum TaxID=906689 RepID=A0A2I0VI90_9ASPA|nr:hypothetical protein MA16_Dca027153 [Dendrobium catenatum]
MVDPGCSSPLVAPSPMPDLGEIDLEAGPGEQLQCRICLETDGRDFIAPCKCKGTSKYVHRECLDHWRSVKGLERLYFTIKGLVVVKGGATLWALVGHAAASRLIEIGEFLSSSET